jgi:catechol 2,3-dioxygenase-like lactoylglutathione lyase family enzyme
MPIQRLNHAVLYVRDVERSVAFYTEALGFRVVMAMPGQAASCRPPTRPATKTTDCSPSATRGAPPRKCSTVGLTTAWEVDTLAELRRIRNVLAERGALSGLPTTARALYAQDPDGTSSRWLAQPAALLDPDEKISPCRCTWSGRSSAVGA